MTISAERPREREAGRVGQIPAAASGDGVSHVLCRVPGVSGELVLRERDGTFEVVCDGIFLMDTHDGRSERLLVSAALACCHEPRDVLIGGLGVGFSLRQALDDPRVRRVTVLEREPAVVAWHHTHLAKVSGGALLDPRVRVVVDDVVGWLQETHERFDVVCLDVDNGPEWTVGETNQWLYDLPGLTALRDRLTPDGTLSVWSAQPCPAFAARLRTVFGSVETLEVPVSRGAPDVVYLAHPAGGTRAAPPLGAA